MKLAYVALAALAGGCFSPNFQEGSPCSAEMTCPGDQTCIMGSCFASKTPDECTGLVTISKTSELACPTRDTILTASAGRNYQWSNGETNRSIRTRAAGTYRVAVDGCMSEELTLLDQTPVVTIQGPSRICGIHGETTTLTADEQPDYLWSTGETTRSIVVHTPGMYTVTSGCFTSEPVTVGGPTPAVVTTECVGGRLTLTAGAASSYLWSNGGTTQSIQPTVAGPYSVKVDGCVTSPSVFVSPEDALVPPISVPFSGAPATFKVPACVTSLTIEAFGAQGGGANTAGVQDGGKGARELGTFTVTPGETLNLVVGQQGATGTCFVSNGGGQGGGGGGSFVWRASDTALPLIAAGGGGGSAANATVPCVPRVGRPGQAATPTGLAQAGAFNTVGAGGAAGDNGTGGGAGGLPNPGTGGGGWLTAGAGAAGTCTPSPCTGGGAGAGLPGTFAGGANGVVGGNGGFGGGGGSVCGGGGGGGFSGGGGGEGTTAPAINYCPGGGGGSINRGMAPLSEAGNRTGNGIIVFTW